MQRRVRRERSATFKELYILRGLIPNQYGEETQWVIIAQIVVANLVVYCLQ